MTYWALKVWVALSKGPQTAGRELLETKWEPRLARPVGLQVNITLTICNELMSLLSNFLLTWCVFAHLVFFLVAKIENTRAFYMS